MKMIYILFPALVVSLLLPVLSPTQIEWLRSNSEDIEVDETYQNGSWEPVIERMKDKRVIMLGEFSHGCQEIFQSRNDLIKVLHETLGIKVILFESGLGEVGTINLYKEEFSAAEMVRGLIGPWRNSHLVDLMQFVKDQQIAIGGYDIQRSGRQFVRLLNEVLAESGIRALHVENQYASIRSLLSNRNVEYDSVSTPTLQLITQYESIANKLASETKQDDRIYLTLQTIQNRVDYLRYMLQFAEDKNWRLRWKARDEGMANNLEFISKTFYPEETILVIGHNFHIARYNEHEEVMGELLSFHDPKAIYTLGVFAGGGTYATNSGAETAMMPPDENTLDIKEVIKYLGGRVNFLPIGEFEKSPENAWLFQPLVINDSFIDLIGSNKLAPTKHFDGLLLLDKVTAVTN